MAQTNIEWTELTWNPSTGCTKISEGCANCYAEKMTRRLHAMGMEKYASGFKLKCHPEELNIPYEWKKPRMIFVNSMSDLFHEDMPLGFIKKVFRVMNQNPQHVFQVLTKRSDVLKEYSPLLDWGPNIWMGVSVESKRHLKRINNLRDCGAHIKFLSLEPLLSELPGLDVREIDWVIVGGESGAGARGIDAKWVRDIRDVCIKKEVPFFFKQWGGFNKKAAGKMLDGKIWCQMPEVNSEQILFV